ncbi:hypothetical protein A1O3_04901 [Capronia epimyces CBS 606.96]|uniref:ubiquitinyl hydrolase 1 n=1 Tax=Capronia epimyces CBS 606.96 TaxID=1182542 RepID=W9YPP4_9EURO|nr:uncharacterized protein A1O3_04901 [Capronia epimyces CBS 606.96]EXJ84234.1 hypothetical protein A1O3_04901 [Capronia epimyces CBS 606.96]
MSSLPARANESPFYDYAPQKPFYPTETKIISTLALLVFGYYVVSYFDASPSTIKRSLYESLIYLIPSPLLYVMQYGMLRLGRLGPEEAQFARAQFGDIYAKQEAIQRIFGQPQLPLALRKVRSLSGVGKYISLSNEACPPGLGNWDNSCYQNSVLQGLASLPAFSNFMERSLEKCERYGIPSDTHRALVCLLEQLTDWTPRKATVWTPNVLKSMDSWQQQDAQEYFSRLLETVEKEAGLYIKVLTRSSVPGLECIRAQWMHNARSEEGIPPRHGWPSSSEAPKESGPRLLQSQPRNPMDGMTAQCLECRTCGFTEGFSFNQFNCLTLNMGIRGPSDLEDLLNEYTAPEEIEGVECENCTKLAHNGANGSYEESVEEPVKRKPILRTKTKQITVGRLPKDLVLHINRSIFDGYGNQLKNRACVAVPAKLRFLSRWCAPIVRNNSSVEAEYELKCMVTHYGRHDNGHYVALGQRGKEWYSFNDDLVTKITEEDVLHTGNGFMLFYEAIPFQQQVDASMSMSGLNRTSQHHISNVDTGSTSDQVENMAEWSSGDSGIDRQDLMSAVASSTESPSVSASPSSLESESAVESPAKQQDIEELSLPSMRTASQVGHHLQEQRQPSTPIVPVL